MKRIFIIFVSIIGIAWYVLGRTSTLPRSPIDQTILPSPSTTSPISNTVTVDGKSMAYWYIRTTPSHVRLIPNFSSPKTSSELMELHKCKYGANGGFYDTDNRPLGQFSSDGETLRTVSGSTLINGFIAVDEDNSAFISNELPDIPYRFSMQTGPLLMAGGEPKRLSLIQDEHARRMIAAITDKREILFIVLFDQLSTFEGPLLKDVPEYIHAVSTKESLQIDSAINLDGGSASAFYGNNFNLSELTPVGSFFCVQT